MGGGGGARGGKGTAEGGGTTPPVKAGLDESQLGHGDVQHQLLLPTAEKGRGLGWPARRCCVGGMLP